MIKIYSKILIIDTDIKNKTLTSDELQSIFNYYSIKKEIINTEVASPHHHKKIKI